MGPDDHGRMPPMAGVPAADRPGSGTKESICAVSSTDATTSPPSGWRSGSRAGRRPCCRTVLVDGQASKRAFEPETTTIGTYRTGPGSSDGHAIHLGLNTRNQAAGVGGATAAPRSG
jgi:hypothetical protein